MALYLSGMASTSCSTSDWDRNRGGLSLSEGSGTLIAGLIAIRLFAIAASRHWRSAKTALRMLEGERPAASISATQLRTAALVIPTSGVVPNLGNTWTFSVIPSAGGQPEVVRVWIQSAAHFSSRISPRR